MFHYLLYKTTNLINGKTYIGIHKTKDVNDGYIGSGKLLLRAIEKYGKENFQTEILLDCLSMKDLLRLEAEIVNEDFIQRNDTYNLKIGGEGGFYYINKNKLNPGGYKKIDGEESYHSTSKLLLDENFRIKFSEKIRKGLKNSNFNNKTFLGRKHTEESKRKISEANKISLKGEKNSQYGTMWITNGIDNKKIKKNEPIPNGYKRGRTI